MRNQYDFYQGMMTIKLKGKLIEPYLQACTRQGCQISHLKRIGDEEVVLTIRLQDWAAVRSLRKKYRCKITIVGGKGVPFLVHRMLRKTSLMIAFAVALILIFVLANTLWSIEVKGLNPELEASVEKRLKSYGVSPGKLTIGMSDPNEIQAKLLDDIPDLLWIGVKKQGTSYHLYGVEKIRHDTDKNTRPSYLVAEKKGMIIRPFIRKGRPLVSVYDIVEKGQPLATGELVEEGEIFVHTEGEVIAETWYKVEQQLPTRHILNLTDGEPKRTYGLKVGSIDLPLWGWWGKDEGTIREENVITDWQIKGWKLPVQWQFAASYKMDPSALEKSKEDLGKMGAETAKRSLKRQLDEDAEILDEKVLHLGEEHGKVKLILLFKVHEDIAETKYISQGD
ncbi:sporulation protein YqfD [Halobacillus litoralis]|uniref:sporulation protein YqfD n=1 Tax=Halobacillus litoralis TaxID=45668 RepID=UPI001CD457E7|nr:sporulation protein YqfD [Halobacillus litoralis]MCA0970040.1 sporulation protein YqfD [Halobacillus litoralis]